MGSDSIHNQDTYTYIDQKTNALQPHLRLDQPVMKELGWIGLAFYQVTRWLVRLPEDIHVVQSVYISKGSWLLLQAYVLWHDRQTEIS